MLGALGAIAAGTTRGDSELVTGIKRDINLLKNTGLMQ